MFKTFDTVPASTLEDGDTFDSDGTFTVVSFDDQGDNIHLVVLDRFEDKMTLDLNPNEMVSLVVEVDEED